MKPDWKDSPDWAVYLAMDSYGDWYWYDRKPKVNTEEGEWHTDYGNLQWAGSSGSWTDSLEERQNHTNISC
jgi:hypothetical protein